jgi:hypothetical protein
MQQDMSWKNPFASLTTRQIQMSLGFTTAVCVTWLVLSFSWSGQIHWPTWAARSGVALFLAYSWLQGVREIKRRKEN